jgi:hypothetical protein
LPQIAKTFAAGASRARWLARFAAMAASRPTQTATNSSENGGDIALGSIFWILAFAFAVSACDSSKQINFQPKGADNAVRMSVSA